MDTNYKIECSSDREKKVNSKALMLEMTQIEKKHSGLFSLQRIFGKLHIFFAICSYGASRVYVSS